MGCDTALLDGAIDRDGNIGFAAINVGVLVSLLAGSQRACDCSTGLCQDELRRQTLAIAHDIHLANQIAPLTLDTTGWASSEQIGCGAVRLN